MQLCFYSLFGAFCYAMQFYLLLNKITPKGNLIDLFLLFHLTFFFCVFCFCFVAKLSHFFNPIFRHTRVYSCWIEFTNPIASCCCCYCWFLLLLLLWVHITCCPLWFLWLFMSSIVFLMFFIPFLLFVEPSSRTIEWQK